MSRYRHLLLVLLLAAGVLVGMPTPAAAHSFDVLVFSKTAGFRHDSIPAGIQMIRELGAENEFTVTATEDAAQFTDANLAQYDVVVWLSTTGDVLNADQQAAFERYVRAGGGYAGIHAAADTEYLWPWYGQLVGAYFAAHPHNQNAVVRVPDRQHLSTKDLPQRWTRFDEWYNYRANPRGNVHVLATLDESSYQPGTAAMGHDHPIAWCQNYDGGRSWYTGMGHTIESYTEPAFRQHVLGGIKTASGHDPADCGATVRANLDQVTLAKGQPVMGEPMGLAVLPDGGVLHTSRDGTVHYTARAGETATAAQIPVYSFREDGMQGIAIDPDFATNKWVYLFYSPRLDTPPGEVPHNSDDPSVWEPYRGYNQISRFRFTSDGKLDPASEQKIIQIPQDRGNCCHHGGDLDFDAQGNLFVSTGDDADPFESNGYSPIDDRVTRAPQFDARRSAGNTNDLRGKILRIKVAADGTYTIPDGNLFPPGTEKTRPEIYAMGFRNPFRIDVDDKTGVVWVGDYGPDAGGPNQYGPGGQVEFDRVDGPGNYGWPYCTGTNSEAETYAQRTFTSTYTPQDPNKGDNDPVGPKFDCAGPQNSSRLNTGLTTVPPAKPSWIKYDGASMPELGGGSESPMGGPVYHYDPANPSKTKFPAYYDNQFFAYEFGRRWVKSISVDGANQPLTIDPFSAGLTLTQLIDAEFGPDGSLYILDYGTGFFNGDQNSAVYRIDYVAGSRSPIAVATANKTSGLAPLEVSFSSAGSRDPDPGDAIVAYAWDFDGNDTTDSTLPHPTHTYTTNGSYTARLTVTDTTGRTAVSAVEILVGNTAPVVSIDTPPKGKVYVPGETLPYQVTVIDPDGQPVDCAKVKVTFALGHDSHTHGGESKPGCSGTIATIADASHGTDDNIFGLLLAEFTDIPPSPDAPPVKGTAEIILQPDHRQAEHFKEMNGIQVVSDGTGEGGARVGYIDNGDWIAFEPYNLKDIKGLALRGSSGAGGGTVTVRMGSPTGPALGSVYVPSTGGWTNYVDLDPVPITDPGGTHKLYLTFSGGFDVDSFKFLRALPQPCPGPRPPADDEFDGTALDRCRWQVVRHAPANLRVADGNLQIDAVAGDMFGGTMDAKNLVLQPAPASFEAVTKLDVGGTDDFEQAGVLVTGTGNNFVKAMLINIPGQGWRMEFGQNINGTAVFDPSLDRSGVLPASIADAAWVKVRSDGHTLTAYWSSDGTTWTQFGRARALNTLPEPKVGLAAFNGAGATAKFDFFHLTPVDAAPCTATAPEPGYASLFDGTASSLTGWSMAGPGGFAYAGCELMSHGGLGLYWYKRQSFGDYSLKLDWKMAGDDNSGVFVGFPDVGTDPWVAVNNGREVQIDATDDPDSTTGAIYNAQAPDAAARDAALKPPGQWNQFEIVVQGNRVKVHLNGVLINDWTETDPNRLKQPSFIGLQNHGNGDEVFYRNIRARELTPPVVTLTGVEDGATYGDSKQLTPTFAATDTESGVATVTATLDGAQLANNTKLDLYKLPLGVHTLTVTATDRALNQATKTVRFTTTTSYADVRQLVTAFRSAGRISHGQAVALQVTLRTAETASSPEKARAALRAFKAIAGTVRDAEVRTVLRRDADVLIERTQN